MDLRRLALVLLLATSAGACASSGAPRALVMPPGSAARGATIAAEARTYTGVAYRAGGGDPTGFDCSGFVQYLYRQAGIALPRTAESQFDAGRSLRSRDLEAGDLVFFRTEGRRISHVGIATGHGTFIHAPNARSRVRVDRLDAAYWSDRYAGARRIVRP
ncbi:MAG: C40 family peptidase [Acidobacteria bacterium]|nr:C40 family peptidase [Acidobacteriota bacterium]